MRDRTSLYQLQALPLDAKILLAEQRIREWYTHFYGDVYISFSGGKDSTVLAHLVRGMYPNVPLVFANTGLEYPEIQAFARKMGAEFVRPKMSFSEVISTYGYPLISKETAEAIHAARRIVNHSTEICMGGGGYKEETPMPRGTNSSTKHNGTSRMEMGGSETRRTRRKQKEQYPPPMEEIARRTRNRRIRRQDRKTYRFRRQLLGKD